MECIFDYRISSNKRRGVYLIFVILEGLLEGGTYFEIRDFRFQVFAYSMVLIDL